MRAAASFPCRPDQCAVARRWLTDWLGEDHPVTYAAVQLLSEAFGNSVVHSRPRAEGLVRLAVELTDGLFRAEVTDGGAADDPTVGEAGGTQEGGRGLFILEQLAKDWGWDRHPDGTLTLWYTLAF